MPRDNICMNMEHVCFYVCCIECMRVCRNVCCGSGRCLKIVGFYPWSVEVLCVFV